MHSPLWWRNGPHIPVELLALQLRPAAHYPTVVSIESGPDSYHIMAWKSELSFSERLAVITSITNACRRASPSTEFAMAHSEATRIEGEAYANASSKDEYHVTCQKAIDGYDNQDVALGDEESLTEWSTRVKAEIESRRGEKVGLYEKAVHDKDGLFSSIYKSTTSEGLLVALKVTTPHLTEPPHDSEREARLLKQVSSETIIPLLESFHEGGSHFVLVFPYMRYQLDELFHGNQLTPRQIRSHLRDLFRALAHIHSMGIIHRDVKPSNVLLRGLGGPAYLADFGIAWSPDDKSSEAPDEKITDVGTTCYRPPEILFGNKTYDTSLDMWAAGCVVAEAIEPDHPQLFDAGPVGSELALVHSIFTTLGTPTAESWPSRKNMPDWGKIEFREYSPRTWDKVLGKAPSLGRDLVANLVKYEGSERLTAEKVLEDPFLTF
ncbi:CMGC/CDK protein kinase [Coccidioides immitis RS]|uniref:cyclin-dependent kinase n=4 Tax=Coccidioides immitis TaxID=5501 RepID=J3KB98_COCIM|nr:CMGC/CDK protein kinase [Coccidioides immitis RS]EAS32377.3 CMGC/CDK protein kinase [Coccidioides immitis RS]